MRFTLGLRAVAAAAVASVEPTVAPSSQPGQGQAELFWLVPGEGGSRAAHWSLLFCLLACLTTSCRGVRAEGSLPVNQFSDVYTGKVRAGLLTCQSAADPLIQLVRPFCMQCTAIFKAPILASLPEDQCITLVSERSHLELNLVGSCFSEARTDSMLAFRS
jgi:hypothetical protein